MQNSWAHTIAAYRVLQRSVIGGSIPDLTAKVPLHTSYKTKKTLHANQVNPFPCKTKSTNTSISAQKTNSFFGI